MHVYWEQHLNAENLYNLACAKHIIATDGVPPDDCAAEMQWSADQWYGWAISWLSSHRETLQLAIARQALDTELFADEILEGVAD